MKISRIAGFFILLALSACSGSPVNGQGSALVEESPFPATTVELTVIPTETPSNPVQTETSIPPSNTIAPPCLEKTGSVETYEIIGNEQVLTGRIYTPPCYGENPDQEYPTLYLLHGSTNTDQQWDDLGIDELANELISGGEISPLIIIMPRESTWIVLPENLFGDHLVKILIPWVDKEYQTLEDRHYRAIGGLSRGGNWAVRLGLLHWGLFGSVGAHSTPLFFGDQNRLPGWIESMPASKTPRIFLDIGEGDNNLPETEQLRKTLLSYGIPHEWRLNPGLHDDIYWQAHLEEYLLWYSAGWDNSQ